MRREILVLWVLGAAAAGGLSCGDPVHDAEVSALGPEPGPYPPGPLHRAGQPCLTCHGGLGPASAEFVTAGTVYVNQYMAATALEPYAPLVGGIINLVDANGVVATPAPTTNSVGNFFVTADQWDPVFPIGGPNASQQISVAPAGQATNTTPMLTHIARGGVYASCAYCHFDPPGPTTPGHVYQN
jgi:hypothetical protein